MEDLFPSPAGQHPVLGVCLSACSILATIFAWVSLQQLQYLVAIGASCGAMISALLGARYFIYATKEKILNIQNLKEKL